MSYKIREMHPEEYPLLRDFLYMAIYLPEGVEPPPESILDSPALQVYIAQFGSSRHDKALVAELDGEIVGAVWSRIMNDYGHLDDTTPSLAMSVCQSCRRQGIGTALLQHLLVLLKASGYSKVSLSVQKANFAVNLYRQNGFLIVAENSEEYIMAATLQKSSVKDIIASGNTSEI